MIDIFLNSPTVGLVAIDRSDSTRMSLPMQSEHRTVGRQVRQSIHSLYDHTTVSDLALGLTVPSSIDAEMLQPHRFEPALLDTFDKVAANLEEHPETGSEAHATLSVIKAAWEQCRYNVSALNQA